MPATKDSSAIFLEHTRQLRVATWSTEVTKIQNSNDVYKYMFCQPVYNIKPWTCHAAVNTRKHFHEETYTLTPLLPIHEGTDPFSRFPVKYLANKYLKPLVIDISKMVRATDSQIDHRETSKKKKRPTTGWWQLFSTCLLFYELTLYIERTFSFCFPNLRTILPYRNMQSRIFFVWVQIIRNLKTLEEHLTIMSDCSHVICFGQTPKALGNFPT